MKIKCDDCETIFELNNDFKAQYLEKGIVRTYFICPNCGKEYTAYYTNKKVRDNQEKIRELSEKVKKLPGKKALNISYQIEELTKSNKLIMGKIRKELEGGQDRPI